MTGGRVQDLVDLDPVQGFRIGVDAFCRLIGGNHADPFGHGSVLAGKHRGTTPREGNPREPRLVSTFLRSLDGSLPDYLLEALQEDLVADEQGLHDFLGVFDKRLLQLWLAAERQANPVSEADAGAHTDGADKGAGVIDGMARLVGRGSSESGPAAQMLPALLSLMLRGQNLETFRRVLCWLTNREVRVLPRFNHKQSLDPECRFKITRTRRGQPGLGRGLVLGARAVPASGRLEIEIECHDAADLTALRSGQAMLATMHALTTRFLHDPVPVSYFARVARAHLVPPRLSRDRALAARIGHYGCLDPATRPGAKTRVKLDIPTPSFSGVPS